MPLDVGRAHVCLVGVAFNHPLLDAGAVSRAVTTLGAFRRFTVNLDQFGSLLAGSRPVLGNDVFVWDFGVSGFRDIMLRPRSII